MGYRVSGFGKRFCHSGDVRHRLRTWRSFGTGILALLLFPSVSRAQHLRIFACAIANDSGMFLGGSSDGSGLYQSDDTGKTWKHLGWENIKCYSMDEVNSSNGRILYEATGLGVLRSTDYGAHWKQITDWRVDEAMDIAVNQKNPNEMYIATAHGAWQSKNEGLHWLQTTNSFASIVSIDSTGSPTMRSWSEYHDLNQIGLRDNTIVGNDLSDVSISWGLEKGVQVFDSRKPQSEIHSLIHCQIWTLKSFLVTP